MTARAFQSALAEMLIRPDLRDAVRESAAVLDERDLSPIERRRLASVAREPGLDAARRMHVAFRLTKLVTFLPRTCAALGDDGLERETRGFWEAIPPRAFFFEGEARDFAAWLRLRLGEGLVAPGLAEALEEEAPFRSDARPRAVADAR